jgi:hypothetical protein
MIAPRLIVFAALLAAAPALADPAEPLLVQAEAQTLTPFCSGRSVQIEGNHNVVTLIGLCRALVLKGDANQVSLTLGANATIRVEGSGNHVTYRAPTAPAIVALGQNIEMTAVPETGPAVTPTTLTLDGDDQALAADCTGRDVTVHGNRAMYLLRGGCRSMTIDGHLIVVQAEMAPNAAITITGHGDRVAWALLGNGQPPSATIHGDGNAVEHLDQIGGMPVHK